MKYHKRILPLFFVILFLTGATGCGKAEIEELNNNISPAPQPMETTPVVDYAVPQLLPNVLVDIEGYSLKDEKFAMVKGKSLPESFRIVDSATGKVVYIGEIEDIEVHEEEGFFSGIADFGEFDTEGLYYLECDRIGQSLRFPIREEMYQALFEENYGRLMEKCRDRSLTVWDAIGLLEAYEWYGEIFPDKDKDGTPDVLTELRGFVSYREEGGKETEEALYAALLAKFSYLYQKFDLTYATECLQRASTVFGQVQTTVGKDADLFFALTELYRATGLSTYRGKIQEYKNFFSDNSTYLEETSYAFGSMTYLATRQRVDVRLCEIFINSLMARAEEISERYEDMIHPVNAKNNGQEDLLKKVTVLSCANYIVNNYQHTRIIEEFLHYLMGRNAESVNIYDTSENKTDYFLYLAQLAAGHK